MTEFTTVLNHASALVSARSRAASALASVRSRAVAVLVSAGSRAASCPAGSARLLSGPAAILAAAALWGTMGTAATLAPAGAPPAAVGSAGLAAGGMLLLGTCRGARPLLAACTRAQRWLIGLGALAVAGYPVTFYPAVARTGVAMATMIALGSAPVFAGLLAWVTGQGRPGRHWAAATAVAVPGCAALVLGPVIAGHECRRYRRRSTGPGHQSDDPAYQRGVATLGRVQSACAHLRDQRADRGWPG
jgi:hypothetical protein